MKFLIAIATLAPSISWAAPNEACNKKIESYALSIARLEPEGADGVEYCGTNVENCMRPLEVGKTDADGNTEFVATHEFGGNYPNFNMFFFKVDSFCQIIEIRFMRH